MRALTLGQAEEKAGCEAARGERGGTGPGPGSAAPHRHYYTTGVFFK